MQCGYQEALEVFFLALAKLMASPGFSRVFVCRSGGLSSL